MTAPRIALLAGSFDPMTNGHLDIARAGLQLFDEVLIAIGVHHGKAGLFSFEERAALIRTALEKGGLDVSRTGVVAFDGLVVDAARAHGAVAILRGLRDGRDFDYEMEMAGMNAAMAPAIQTVFVPASTETRPISATLVRQIASMGGEVSAFVPANVEAALKAKFNR